MYLPYHSLELSVLGKKSWTNNLVTAASRLPFPEGGIAIAVQPGEDRNVDGKRFISILGSTYIHRDFGVLLWKTLPKQLEDGVIVPNRVEKLSNGLAGIVDGLKRLEDNLVSGVKLVAFPQETI
ncbi:hypothetical protein B0H11DRAFT_2229789 [Mycena galericulata]|nr:hypothetical protein B0H11DRAFT_2229789 [Mycena galericulata]